MAIGARAAVLAVAVVLPVSALVVTWAAAQDGAPPPGPPEVVRIGDSAQIGDSAPARVPSVGAPSTTGTPTAPPRSPFPRTEATGPSGRPGQPARTHPPVVVVPAPPPILDGDGDDGDDVGDGDDASDEEDADDGGDDSEDEE
jgi:hypothetical protein